MAERKNCVVTIRIGLSVRCALPALCIVVEFTQAFTYSVIEDVSMNLYIDQTAKNIEWLNRFEHNSGG